MAADQDFPKKVRELAEGYFKEKSHNCAESVFRALMTASGRDCPPELVRMASPFGRGMGSAGCACGALVGGQMALGIMYGRGEECGPAPTLCGEAAKQLHKRFVKKNGAACCRILHKGLPFGTEEQLSACCLRSVDAAEIAAEIIAEITANGGFPQKGRIL